MDAIEYLKVKSRMCKNTDCDYCPIGYDKNGVKEGCSDFEKNYPKNATDLIEKWAKKHPAKTYLMDFKEKFPNAIFNSDGLPTNKSYDDVGSISVKTLYGIDKSWFDEME